MVQPLQRRFLLPNRITLADAVTLSASTPEVVLAAASPDRIWAAS